MYNKMYKFEAWARVASQNIVLFTYIILDKYIDQYKIENNKVTPILIPRMR